MSSPAGPARLEHRRSLRAEPARGGGALRGAGPPGGAAPIALGMADVVPAGWDEPRIDGREPPIPAMAGRTARILVVDADPAAAARTARLLRQNLYEVECVTDASPEFVNATLARADADMIVLEPVGPAGGAPEVWRQLLDLEPPVLVFSRAADPLDRVAGLELGAEDYLDKAAHPLEFLARVRAILRRRHRASPRAMPGGWRLQIGSCRLTSPGGLTAWLTPSDLALLRALADRPRMALSREILTRLVYGAGRGVSARAIDARVVRLRDKLEALGGRQLIRTVRPCGWALEVDVEVDET